jgi:hypothetical protein
MRTLLLLAGFPMIAISQTMFEERPALVLKNDKVELTVLLQGSTFANLVVADDPEKLSPLWNPVRMAREAGEKNNFDLYFGHFVCVDGFGPASAEEQAAGLPGHGEAHRQPFDVKVSKRDGKTQTLTLAARLPIAQESFTRTLQMVDGENVIYVGSELESLLGFDRPAFWAEHATIGSPFLEPGVTVVDMPAKRAKTRPYQSAMGGLPHRLPSDQEFTWPDAPALTGGKINLRAGPTVPNSGDHTACLLDPSRKYVFVTALNPRKHMLLGYVFKPEEYPWEQNWEFYPPNGKLARGMEFSTQPFDVPRREAVQLNSLFGTPVYRWLPAKSTIKTTFLFFYTRTPDGFAGVDNVVLENGVLVVTDSRTGVQIKLPASLAMSN